MVMSRAKSKFMFIYFTIFRLNALFPMYANLITWIPMSMKSSSFIKKIFLDFYTADANIVNKKYFANVGKVFMENLVGVKSNFDEFGFLPQCEKGGRLC